MSELPLTGERVIEDRYRSSPGLYAIYLMHMASYRFAEQFTSGKRVLDLGCGSGYGAALIAEHARNVVAVDVSEEAIRFASSRYHLPNLTFQQIGAGKALPYPSRGFDVVLSFQVIEHVQDDVYYVEEASRVLADDGVLVVITPNRHVRLLPGQKPWNRWHLREYDAGSLSTLFVTGHFTVDMQFMSASGDVAALELRRYKRLKWMTLPFTLPLVPDSWRVRGLNLLHALSGKGKRPTETSTYNFDERDILIGHDQTDALNLVAIARKRIRESV